MRVHSVVLLLIDNLCPPLIVVLADHPLLLSYSVMESPVFASHVCSKCDRDEGRGRRRHGLTRLFWNQTHSCLVRVPHAIL